LAFKANEDKKKGYVGTIDFESKIRFEVEVKDQPKKAAVVIKEVKEVKEFTGGKSTRE
jgi:hypothetical protein